MTYTIGDIHGCAKTFRTLLSQIGFSKEDSVYFLGDYIDRGPDSKGVIDQILQLTQEGFTVNTLRGNHEQMMLDSAKDSRSEQMWLYNGGGEALHSFGVSSFEFVDQKYKNFLNETKYYFEVRRYILVHAGLNMSISDPLSDTNAMLWSRPSYKSSYNGLTIIHGHTPTPLETILGQDPKGVAINLDGGCVYRTVPGLGYLVGFCLETGEYHYCKNVE